MAPADRLKCEDLSRRCKTGYVPTSVEMKYLERMFSTYPEDYAKVAEETRKWATRMMNPMAKEE